MLLMTSNWTYNFAFHKPSTMELAEARKKKIILHTTHPRHVVLTQVSHYTFAMCSYAEKRAEPTEMMQLDGYTIDYCEAVSGGLLNQ